MPGNQPQALVPWHFLFRFSNQKLVPVFYADILALAFEPAFQIDGGATTITRGGNCLAIAVVGDITGGKDTGNIRHCILSGNNIALFIHVDEALEQAGIRLVSNRQEQPLRWQDIFLAIFHIAQSYPVHGIIAQDLNHFRIPDKADLWILEGAVLHNLAGAQAIASMYDRDMAGIARQERRLFQRRIAAADDYYILVAEEKSITGRAGADAASLQASLAWQAQPFRARSSGNNDGASCIIARIGSNFKWPLTEVDRAHIFGDHLGTEAPGLHLEFFHHRRSQNALFKARIILYLAGQHQLPAYLVALKHQHRQVSARGINPRGIASRPRTNNDNVIYFCHSRMTSFLSPYIRSAYSNRNGQRIIPFGQLASSSRLPRCKSGAG